MQLSTQVIIGKLYTDEDELLGDFIKALFHTVAEHMTGREFARITVKH